MTQPNPQISAQPDGFHQKRFSLPPGATEVLMVRHGASAPILEGTSFPLLDGRGNPELAEAGVAQAEGAGRRLANEHFDRLFVSPMRRTRETAEILTAATGHEPAYVEDLVEIGLGELDGGQFRVRLAEGDPVAREVFAAETWEVLPGAETAAGFAARIRAGVDHVVAETGPDRIAVAVIHAAVIGEICRQATESRPFAFVHADNGSISGLIVYADGRWLLRSFNDTTHLAGL